MSMSTDEAYHDSDRDRDKGGDSERGDKTDKSGAKQKSSGAKSKDLSHVPCKFFKVGGCTAGPSCPFSHVIHEPGQQKEVCTWFVKGNCKFGHKCALAHILPGQSMAMDRKNKKAAQTAASAASGDKSKSGGKVGGKKDAGESGNKLPLLAGGSTAPTRILNSSSSGSSKSGRPPINMPLKATISPSAPAPPLNDTDFASFATLDGLDGDPTPNGSEESPRSGSKKGDILSDLSRPVPSVDPVPLPPSSARRPSTTAKTIDFGPIGSPPNYRIGKPISPIRSNGSTISPATSPRNQSNMINHGSPSRNGPLSAPGTQDYFVSSSFSMRGQGIPQSLGSGLAMKSGRRAFDDSNASGDIGPSSFSGLLSSQLSSSVSQSSGMNGLGRGEYDITIEYDEFSGARRNARKGMERGAEDEELEDFLPSSLNDLLTPEERSRRMSRSNSGQKPGISHLTSALASANLAQSAHLTSAGNRTEVPTGGNGNPALGHRYSHSVPAPALLADIKSIWFDPSVNPISSSPRRGGIPTTISATLGSGNDEAALSMSMGSVGGGTPSSLTMISPSNASAAFLPGLHKHYLDAKAKQAQQAQHGHTGIGGHRGASNPFANNGGLASSNSLAINYLQPLGAVGVPSTVSNSSNLHMHIHGNTSTAYRTTPSPFDLTQTLHQPHPQAARPISNLTAQASKMEDPLLAPTLLSPSSRALQSHAPGQSLPQGLAAGYSRIHALPPLTNITSPSNGSSFMPGSSPGSAAVLGNGSEGPFGEWSTIAGSNQLHSMSGTGGQGLGGSKQSNAGLDSMFSRLSYAATTRNNSGGHAGAVNVSGPPPGLARNISGGKYNHPLSPLSRPVVTKDDDILFDMDK